jgi:replicative DNA helicase
MASPELELISNVVKTGSFSPLQKNGVTPEFFETEEGGVVFKWLWDEYHSSDYRGEIPDKTRLLRKFPDFDFCPSRNSVSALIAELQDRRLSNEIERLSGEMQGLINDGEDPKLVLQAFLPQMRELNVQSSPDHGLHMRSANSELRQEYGTVKTAGGITGIPFPWAPLNIATGGMQPEDFIVLYGRPKNMKSWVAYSIAVHAYLHNRRVFAFSKELRQLIQARRCASLIAKLDYTKVKTATLSPEEEEDYFAVLDGLEEYEDATVVEGHRRALYFASDKGKRKSSTVDDLLAQCERFEPDLVLVDGLYLLGDGRTQSRNADWKNISHISQDLKGLAQYLEVPTIGITQANRANAKAPTDNLDDLSYADSLGQDADLAMRVFKGPNPGGKYKYAIALTFPGMREADIPPFLINAFPGGDFSLLQKSVDMKAFLESKKALDREEENIGAAAAAPSTAKKKPKRKSQFRG